MKTTYVPFEIINGTAQVLQPAVRDGVEVWEALPAGRAEFGGRNGWYWQRRSYLNDRDMTGFPAIGGFANALHGPFESERAAREDMAALKADRPSVHWPTMGDPIKGFETRPPKEFEAGYVETIDLARDQWSIVEGTVAVLPGATRDAFGAGRRETRCTGFATRIQSGPTGTATGQPGLEVPNLGFGRAGAGRGYRT
jgi:hypothetical protein